MIGFIGAGNMATALIQGMLCGGMDAKNIGAFDISSARREAMQALGISVFDNLHDLSEASETLVLAVKPYHISGVLAALAGEKPKNLLSIVVSISTETLQSGLPVGWGVVRTMPNTPSLVGEGVIAFCDNHTISADAFSRIWDAFSLCGKAILVPESKINAVTAISGSGPAYAYLFIEALADAGVREGLLREDAYTLAAQTVLGAGKMVIETRQHPGPLKDAVCSPGGTTIEAVYALEKAGLRAAVMDAVDACARKIEKLE